MTVRALPMRVDEVRFWRKLMRETMAAINEPTRAGGELLAASAQARSARLPFPPYSWENSFALLVVESAEFALTRGDERTLAQPRIEELFDRCLAAWPNVLEALPPRRKKLKARKANPAVWMNRKDCGDHDFGDHD
jgi:hypothetical protein